MPQLLTTLFGLGCLTLALVLPIVLASRYIDRRGRSGGWCGLVVLSSLLSSVVGFWIGLFAAGRSVPASHDLINMNGLAAGLLGGVVLGIPAGGWIGAWAPALILGRSKRAAG